MNKSFVKVGISIIIVGAALGGLGLLIKIAYENCLEMQRLCREDDSALYFLTALPVTIIGLFVLVLAIKDAPVLQRISGTEPSI